MRLPANHEQDVECSWDGSIFVTVHFWNVEQSSFRVRGYEGTVVLIFKTFFNIVWFLQTFLQLYLYKRQLLLGWCLCAAAASCSMHSYSLPFLKTGQKGDPGVERYLHKPVVLHRYREGC